MSAIEKTLVLVKPDGVKKHICGEVISRFERKGLEVEAIKMIQVPEELAKKHYAEHEGKGSSRILSLSSLLVLYSLWLSKVKTQLLLSAKSTALPIR